MADDFIIDFNIEERLPACVYKASLNSLQSGIFEYLVRHWINLPYPGTEYVLNLDKLEFDGQKAPKEFALDILAKALNKIYDENSTSNGKLKWDWCGDHQIKFKIIFTNLN